MADITRREFVSTSLMAAMFGVRGFGLRIPDGPDGPEGELLGIVPFVDEGRSPIATLIAGSHRGRLVADLAKLDETKLVTPNDAFFIRTRYPDELKHDGPWTLRTFGHVRQETTMRLDDLRDDVEPMGLQLLECSGNSKRRKFGLLSSAEWSGIPIAKVLERAHPTSKATRLHVIGHDEHSDFRTARGRGASWIFSFEQLEAAGAYLATEMNGQPLPRDHGEPVRLIVPNWYGCTCIKWVHALELVDDDAPSSQQMREFSSRTHQDGVPEKARDFIPATMDQTGTAVRVEKRQVGGELVYRVWGVLWGGDRPTDKLMIRFREDLPKEPLESYDIRNNETWTLWSHTWRPKAPGRYQIALEVDDAAIRTRRLDRGYYVRQIDIEEV